MNNDDRQATPDDSAGKIVKVDDEDRADKDSDPAITDQDAEDVRRKTAEIEREVADGN